MKLKKLVSVLLASACVLSLAACGGSGDDADSNSSGGSGDAEKSSSAKTAKVIDIDLTDEEYAFTTVTTSLISLAGIPAPIAPYAASVDDEVTIG